MIRALSRSLTALAVIVLLSGVAAAELQLPEPQGMVNDFDGKLSPQTKQSLENLLANFRARTGVELTLVVTPEESLQGYTVEEYALNLGRKWKVGRASDKLGLVLLIVTKPSDAAGCHGETRLEVSRYLEGDLPDGLAWELIRRMRDDFKKCNFDQALTTGVQTILSTVAQRRGVSVEGVDNSRAYQPRQRPPTRSRGISPSLIIFGLFIIFIIIASLGGRGGPGGRGRRRRGLDGAEWMLWPIIFGSGRGGWGGSSGGSSWGGSGWGGSDGGGGFGGFGGGGDFGGGGASDSW